MTNADYSIPAEGRQERWSGMTLTRPEPLRATSVPRPFAMLFVITFALFFPGCAVKFNASSLSTDDKIGVLVVMGYPYAIAIGPPAASIASTMMFGGTEARGTLLYYGIQGTESITKKFLENWPKNLPSNPKVIQTSDIVKDGRKIDFLSTARKNEVDLLLWIQIDSSLKFQDGSYNKLGSYGDLSIQILGSMIRSSDKKTIWRKRVKRNSSKFYYYDDQKLGLEYKEFIDSASSELLGDLL